MNLINSISNKLFKMNLFKFIIFSVIFNVASAKLELTDYLSDLLKDRVNASFPSVDSTANVVTSIDTSGLAHGTKNGLTTDTFDAWWNTTTFPADLKTEAYGTLSAIKYSEQEIVVLQNFSTSPHSLSHETEYLLVAGTNVNSTIAVSYWSGDVVSTDVQQTYWQGCCDNTCDVGCCKCIIEWGCGGCNQPRSPTASEVEAIEVDINVATRAKVIADSFQDIITFEVTQDTYDTFETTHYFDRVYNEFYPGMTKEQVYDCKSSLCSSVQNYLSVYGREDLFELAQNYFFFPGIVIVETQAMSMECIDPEYLPQFISQMSINLPREFVSKRAMRRVGSMKSGYTFIVNDKQQDFHTLMFMQRNSKNSSCFDAGLYALQYEIHNANVYHTESTLPSDYSYNYIPVNRHNYTMVDMYLFNFFAYEASCDLFDTNCTLRDSFNDYGTVSYGSDQCELGVCKATYNYAKTYGRLDLANFTDKWLHDHHQSHYDASTQVAQMEGVDSSNLDAMYSDIFGDLKRMPISVNMTLSLLNMSSGSTYFMYDRQDNRHSFLSTQVNQDGSSFDFLIAFLNLTVDHANDYNSQWLDDGHMSYHYSKLDSHNSTELDMHLSHLLYYNSVCNAMNYNCSYSNFTYSISDTPREDIHFMGKTIPKEWLGGYVDEVYTNDIWDEVKQGTQVYSDMLKQNISDMGSPHVSQACAVNTCLKFSYFDAYSNSAQVECVLDEYTDDFVETIFYKVLGQVPDPESTKRYIAELEYGENVTWVVEHLEFSSSDMTKPGYAKFWKQRDTTRPCSNWLISFVDGAMKIAPDIFRFTSTSHYVFGLFSSTNVDYEYLPHTVTLEDVLAMGNFFHAELLNSECKALGVGYEITSFPDLDC